MKTEIEIVRYTPASADGHPPTLVVRLKLDIEAVYQGDEAERMKAEIEALKS